MIGRTIAHYKIVEKLGQGGMGVVYKAEDTKLKRTVALKFTPEGALENEEDRARFRGEAQAAAALDHPNICTIYEINEADGQTFIAMKYISGRELRGIVHEGPMPVGRAVGIACQVAMALQEAHENGIVHRDIKSANVMVTDKGGAVVMDFGLAKQLGRVQITKAGTSLGTIDYMSPEQAQGQPVDHRTDIWSLGVMLYEMVAGRLPFKGDFDQAVIYSIVNQDHDPLTQVCPSAPAALEGIVNKAMAKKPDARYQSATEMLDDLNALLSEMGVSTVSRTTGPVTPRPSTASRQSAGGPRFDGGALRVLIGYVAAGAIASVLLQFLVSRFPLSPHWPNFVIIAFAAMLPTIAILATLRGPGVATNLKRIGVPLNILAAAMLLFFVFEGKDLGAATTTVTVADDEGNTIERVIPKSEFRKRIALYYFDNSGDNADDWLQYGFVHLLRYDLYQDLFLTVHYAFDDEIRQSGPKKSTDVPVTLKRSIAREGHFDYFVEGDLTRRGEQYAIEVRLYDSQKGSVAANLTYTGANIFAIVDSMSVDLRKGIGVPDYHLEESVDLPVSEMLTKSPEALKQYSLGRVAAADRNDYVVGAEHLEAAVADDPTFASAHWSLMGYYIGLNRSEEANRSIDRAMELRYKLPEQVQFNLRNSYFSGKDMQDEAFENANRWVTLYPQDVIAHVVLSQLYERRAQYDKAIEKRQDALVVEPNRYDELRQIARLNEVKGAFHKALEYREQYKSLFPAQEASFTEVARLYRIVGDFEKARTNYREALVIEPSGVEIRAALAGIERGVGDFDAALKYCQEALENSKTPQDSTVALQALQGYLTFRGQARDAVEVYEMNLDVLSRWQNPVNLLFMRVFAVSTYVFANDAERAFEELREIESGPMIPQLKSVISAGYLIAYGLMDNPDYLPQMQEQLAKFTEWVDASKAENLRWVIEMCRGHIERWEGRYEDALASYQRCIDLAPQNNVETLTWLYALPADMCRELGRIEQGTAYAEQGLAIEPYNPFSHAILASFAQTQGRHEEARAHMQKALLVYEPADADFPWAKEVRALAAELDESL